MKRAPGAGRPFTLQMTYQTFPSLLQRQEDCRDVQILPALAGYHQFPGAAGVQFFPARRQKQFRRAARAVPACIQAVACRPSKHPDVFPASYLVNHPSGAIHHTSPPARRLQNLCPSHRLLQAQNCRVPVRTLPEFPL